MDSTCS